MITNWLEYRFKVRDLILTFVFFITFLAVVYNSGYALLTIDNQVSIILLVMALLSLICCLGTGILSFSLLINKYTLIYLFMLSSIILTLIFNSQIMVFTSYIRLLLILTLSFLITQFTKFSNFISWYLIFMRFITVVSLIIYFLINNLNIHLPLPTFTNTNGVIYLNGIIFFVLEHAPDRNSAVFWEPGIFSSFLLIAIICECCFREKSNKSSIILFIVGLISTFSTAGYALLVLVLILIFNRVRNKYFSVIITPLLIGASSIILVNLNKIIVNLAYFAPNLFGKIAESSNSSVTRINGPYIDWLIFKENFFWGAGFQGYQKIWKSLAYHYGVIAQTSTITFFIATLGVLGLWYFCILLVGIFSLKSVSILNKIIILIVFVGILSKEPHQYNILMFTFLFYFLKEALPVKKLAVSNLSVKVDI